MEFVEEEIVLNCFSLKTMHRLKSNLIDEFVVCELCLLKLLFL